MDPIEPSLDERKFLEETAAKKRELDLKEREIRANKRPGWNSPIMLAILAATLALIGNVIVASLNNETSARLERVRSQSTLVLEAIKTGNTDSACKNLVFFVNLGLLDDANSAVLRTCGGYTPGAPALPYREYARAT